MEWQQEDKSQQYQAFDQHDDLHFSKQNQIHFCTHDYKF